MADSSLTDEIAVRDQQSIENNLFSTNPLYDERVKKKDDDETWNVNSERDLLSDRTRNGLILDCDEEDKDDRQFIPLTAAGHRVPQLVFLDPDDHSTTDHIPRTNGDLITANEGARELVAGAPETDSNHEFHQNSLLSFSQRSVTSQHSSDSDLITDHNPQEMGPNSNNSAVHGDCSHGERPWHCHDSSYKLPPDKTARNQLIAVCIFCFIFMLAETVAMFFRQGLWLHPIDFEVNMSKVKFTKVIYRKMVSINFLKNYSPPGSLFCMVIVYGGILSNSLALFTDVLHLGSDLISFLISLLSMYLAKKSATQRMSFGYYRAEVVGALASVFLIWAITGVLVYMAIERIINEHYKEVKADEMLVTASLGVAFNIIMGIVLNVEMCCRRSQSHASFGHSHGGGSHGHSHGGTSNGHSHNHKPKKSRSRGNEETDVRRPLMLSDSETTEFSPDPNIDIEIEEVETPKQPHQKNINVRAAFIHVIGDIVQSIGVLVAAVIIKLKPEEKYRLADPICTFIFSILVLVTTINVLKDTLRIIMEGVPSELDYYTIKTSLHKVEGVKSVHGLTLWCLTLEKNALAVHLGVEPSVSHQKVLEEATSVIRKDYNFVQMTIQVEDYKPNMSAGCTDCQELTK